MVTIHHRLVPLRDAAQLLRVPADWLRDEALAGRLPHLRAGDSFLFNLKSVQTVLMDRAAQFPVAQEPHDKGTE